MPLSSVLTEQTTGPKYYETVKKVRFSSCKAAWPLPTEEKRDGIQGMD